MRYLEVIRQMAALEEEKRQLRLALRQLATWGGATIHSPLGDLTAKLVRVNRGVRPEILPRLQQLGWLEQVAKVQVTPLRHLLKQHPEVHLDVEAYLEREESLRLIPPKGWAKDSSEVDS